MSERNYWIDLFTPTTWHEFVTAGASVSGFRESTANTVTKIKIGDYLLCYVTKVSRFIGVLEVVGSSYVDQSSIWKEEVFPYRVKVKMIASLSLDTAVTITKLKQELNIFNDDSNPKSWSGYVRRSPTKIGAAEGQAIVKAILEAQINPIATAVDVSSLDKPPQIVETEDSIVILPEIQEGMSLHSDEEITEHTEIQELLLRLGAALGLDVWVAKNDRSKKINGITFTNLPRMKSSLPKQFNEDAQRIIEYIDVLWLDETDTIVAAFEIESTTTVYSGLLRMSDLLVTVPNIKIDLYLVAPSERRTKVITEVNRPTFSRPGLYMNQLCRYIPFSTLRNVIEENKKVLHRLKPEILLDWSEPCQIISKVTVS